MTYRDRLAIVMAVVLLAAPGRGILAQSIQLHGAGATFPSPIYTKWFANYRIKNPSVEITYDAIGSEAGIRSLLDRGVDFGASDNPQILEELAPDRGDQYLLFPSIIGAVVPIVNLPGMVKEISFTPQALAGIYSGKIRKWNDPVLRAANHGVSLPDLEIVVVHRKEGSGTSYAWTDYLSQANPEWKSQIGVSLEPKWPVGRGATGNDGVAKLVKELGGSIGYVEFIYALQNHLSYGRVQNRAGEFIAADLESVAAAAGSSSSLDANFKGSIVNAPGEGSYPIVSFTWLIVPSQIPDAAKRSAMADFLQWMLGPGQREAGTLGYVMLPESLISREEAAVSRIQ